ncbi:DUF1153 domain-containing protein [Rhodobacteraceae bacterium nBUS_24]
MSIKDKNGPNVVKLPDNTILSRVDLPAKDTRRWVVSRKLTVVRAVVYGLISLDDALETYAISEEEFFSWVDLAAQHGQKGLRTTYSQLYRQP